MTGFEEIYKGYGKQVHRFLLSLTGDEQLTEELVQETFYRAFLHIDDFEGRSSVLTWLCQIGKNAWLKELRREKRIDRGGMEDYEPADGGPLPESEAIRRDECRRIRLAVSHLKEPYREVFIMHVFGERKLKEIAALYDKSESWAKVTFYRAKAKIVEELEGGEIR